MQKLTNVFTYGSLMYPEVMYGLVKQTNYKTQTAVLKDYARYHVKHAVYPGIIPVQGKSVKGLVYMDVTEEDLSILNRFETAEYKPTEITVVNEKGAKIKAVAYVYLNPSKLMN